MNPLKLTPAFRDYIWGGTRLKDDFNMECGYEKIAEAWVLSCRPDGSSVISGGEYNGKSLEEYIRLNSKSALGTNCRNFEEFPLLIKLIDARDNLSVQVHPDDSYAKEKEGDNFGKTEMWYIIDCEEGAEIILGFKSALSKEQFKRRIEDNTLLEAVNTVNVKKGDSFFIEAGTLHAIGKGILIAEVQQNSNATYRVYDYGRTDKDGNPRELHTDKAIEVTKLSPAEPYAVSESFFENGATKRILAKCGYFTALSVRIADEALFYADGTSFESLLVLEGSAELICGGKIVKLLKGCSVFIPAGLGEYTVSGKCEFILSRID